MSIRVPARDGHILRCGQLGRGLLTRLSHVRGEYSSLSYWLGAFTSPGPRGRGRSRVWKGMPDSLTCDCQPRAAGNKHLTSRSPSLGPARPPPLLHEPHWKSVCGASDIPPEFHHSPAAIRWRAEWAEVRQGWGWLRPKAAPLAPATGPVPHPSPGPHSWAASPPPGSE